MPGDLFHLVLLGIDVRAAGKDRLLPCFRALIRDDMEKQAQRRYVHKELLRSTADIQAGCLHSAAAVKDRSDRVLQDLRAVTRE